MRQVAAAVIVENGRLFLARRGPAEKLAGLWELPGGKLEPGETPQQALERELAEELGMAARVGQVLASTIYEYEHGCFEMLAVAAVRLSGFELRVHDQYLWVDPEAATQLALAPADVKLIAGLGNIMWSGSLRARKS